MARANSMMCPASTGKRSIPMLPSDPVPPRHSMARRTIVAAHRGTAKRRGVVTRNRSRRGHVSRPPWRHARRPAGRHPPDAPGPRPGDRGRGGERARGVGAHRPARPRGARHGRGARCTPARAATAAGSWPGGGRTDLSGLNAAEARALFLVAGPSSAATPEVKAALRKLVRALPEPFRDAAEAASTRRRGRSGGLGPVGRAPGRRRRTSTPSSRRWWPGSRSPSATWPGTGPPAARVVHPLGLASKGAAWYLVAATDARSADVPRRPDHRRSSRPASRSCGPTASTWPRPGDLITDEVDQRRTPVAAQATATTEVIPVLRLAFGTRLRIGPPAGDERVARSSCGATASSRWPGEIAGFGAALEVQEPAAVRHRLAQLAAELHCALRRHRALISRSPAVFGDPVEPHARRGGRPCPPGRPAHRWTRCPGTARRDAGSVRGPHRRP